MPETGSVNRNFGFALEAMKSGASVARAGWNGKNMYVYLEHQAKDPEGFRFEPFFVMFTAQGAYQPGWLASQADMLAEDWMVLDA